MDTASYFYTEEDDLRSWSYSKHLVEQERQEHIKRLREQGIIVPEEELMEEKGNSFFLWCNWFSCFSFWWKKKDAVHAHVFDNFDSTSWNKCWVKRWTSDVTVMYSDRPSGIIPEQLSDVSTTLAEVIIRDKGRIVVN